MNRAYFWNAGTGLILVTGLCSCGGGDGSMEQPGIISSEQTETQQTVITMADETLVEFVPPFDQASLAMALTTRYESDSDFDVWLCSTANTAVAYALPAAGVLGEGRVGIEYSLASGGEVPFTWQAINVSEVRTQFIDLDTEFFSTNYVFSNSTTMSYSLADMTVNCNLVDNTAAFGGASSNADLPPNGDSADSAGALSAAQAPEGFSRLHAYDTFGFVGTSAQLITEVIALFSDGTYTEDLETVFSQGEVVSRSQNPQDWGVYQFSGGDLLLRGDNDPEFTAESREFSLSPAGTDTRLSGCFNSIGGSTTLDVTSLSISSYCFTTSGRFTHDSSLFTSSPNVVSSSGSPDESGNYRLDGYAMRIRYDNGVETTVSFSFMSQDRTHIGVNGSRFIQ